MLSKSIFVILYRGVERGTGDLVPDLNKENRAGARTSRLGFVDSFQWIQMGGSRLLLTATDAVVAALQPSRCSGVQ